VKITAREMMNRVNNLTDEEMTKICDDVYDAYLHGQAYPPSDVQGLLDSGELDPEVYFYITAPRLALFDLDDTGELFDYWVLHGDEVE
jgi:hypothetical protein